MSKNNFDSTYAKIKESLSEKESISLPELQALFDLSYPEAKRVLEGLRRDIVVIGEPIGMKYRINPEIFGKNKLSLVEAIAVRSVISAEDARRLKDFEKATESTFLLRHKLGDLIELDLIKDHCGILYRTIDDESAKLIDSFSLGSSEWFVAFCALEISNAVKTAEGTFDQDDFTFIPDVIRKRLPEFLSEPEPVPLGNGGHYSMAKFLLMESFIAKNCLPDIESYRKRANDELAALNALGLESGVFIDAVEECIGELAELTYENIEDIRKLIDD